MVCALSLLFITMRFHRWINSDIISLRCCELWSVVQEHSACRCTSVGQGFIKASTWLLWVFEQRSLVCCWCFGTVYRSHIRGAWCYSFLRPSPLKMGQIRYSETSVIRHPMVNNNSVSEDPHLHRDTARNLDVFLRNL